MISLWGAAVCAEDVGISGEEDSSLELGTTNPDRVCQSVSRCCDNMSAQISFKEERLVISPVFQRPVCAFNAVLVT